jgi:uncharacterized NAD-dependent epimerase/dehydratase family protein
VVPVTRRYAPIVGSMEEAFEYSPSFMLVGLAPPEGKLAPESMSSLNQATEAGLEIVSGLHQRLAPQFPGRPIWDVCESPEDIPLFSGTGFEVEPKIVLTVGTTA